MHKRSHTLLASALLNSVQGFEARRYEWAFLIGSFQPDCNPLTYIKGSLRAETLRGHNYTNSRPFVHRHIRHLMGKRRWNLWNYYTLGKLTHYVADAFTFPHNDHYTDSLASHHLYERDLRQEVEYLQHAVRQAERQYEISKDTIDLINVKCHDIKYKLGALLSEGNKPASEAVEDLKSSISIYDTRISTGNKILDVILTEKSLYCEQNGINFSCMADGAKLSFMDDGDLYCLFGNIVDNALEAVGKLPERERRVVNLVVKEKNGVLTVQEENYFSGELKFVDGLPRTTKGDSDYHGFGTRSIRMIVNKYGGAFTAGAKDGVFSMTIVFVPDKDKKLQNK